MLRAQDRKAPGSCYLSSGTPSVRQKSPPLTSPAQAHGGRRVTSAKTSYTPGLSYPASERPGEEGHTRGTPYPASPHAHSHAVSAGLGGRSQSNAATSQRISRFRPREVIASAVAPTPVHRRGPACPWGREGTSGFRAATFAVPATKERIKNG